MKKPIKYALFYNAAAHFLFWLCFAFLYTNVKNDAAAIAIVLIFLPLYLILYFVCRAKVEQKRQYSIVFYLSNLILLAAEFFIIMYLSKLGWLNRGCPTFIPAGIGYWFFAFPLLSLTVLLILIIDIIIIAYKFLKRYFYY